MGITSISLFTRLNQVSPQGMIKIQFFIYQVVNLYKCQNILFYYIAFN